MSFSRSGHDRTRLITISSTVMETEAQRPSVAPSAPSAQAPMGQCEAEDSRHLSKADVADGADSADSADSAGKPLLETAPLPQIIQ